MAKVFDKPLSEDALREYSFAVLDLLRTRGLSPAEAMQVLLVVPVIHYKTQAVEPMTNEDAAHHVAEYLQHFSDFIVMRKN